MVTALVQAYGSAAKPSPPPPDRDRERWPGDVHAPPPARHQRRGTPLPLALLIAVVVIGVGGWGVTQGVRYAVGYVTGNESGTERLVQEASGSVDGLTLTVESVEHTAHFTRVDLAARNDTGTPVTLPLFKNCVFVGADGTTLEADAFKSQWSEEVARGGLQRGTVTFGGHLPDAVTRATLSFSTIFRFGPHLPPISVPDIRLRPP
jgi:hypothetical protein